MKLLVPMGCWHLWQCQEQKVTDEERINNSYQSCLETVNQGQLSWWDPGSLYQAPHPMSQNSDPKDLEPRGEIDAGGA
ncbi:hypothetical protein INR49_021877, partial [Caranx melampygus]